MKMINKCPLCGKNPFTKIIIKRLCDYDSPKNILQKIIRYFTRSSSPLVFEFVIYCENLSCDMTTGEGFHRKTVDAAENRALEIWNKSAFQVPDKLLEELEAPFKYNPKYINKDQITQDLKNKIQQEEEILQIDKISNLDRTFN